VQHLANIDYASKQGREILLGHHSKIARQLNVALEFRYRSKGVLQSDNRTIGQSDNRATGNWQLATEGGKLSAKS
jgi:hypothetical protein